MDMNRIHYLLVASLLALPTFNAFAEEPTSEPTATSEPTPANVAGDAEALSPRRKDLSPVAQELEAPRKSVPMTVVGSVITGLGVVQAIAGAVVLGIANSPCEDDAVNNQSTTVLGTSLCYSFTPTYNLIGGSILAAGVAHLAVGIPLIAVGEQRQEPELVPSIAVSPTGASFRLEF